MIGFTALFYPVSPTAVLAATDPKLLKCGSTAVADTTSYCRGPTVTPVAASTGAISEKVGQFCEQSRHSAAATDAVSALLAADLRVPTHTYRCYKCPLAIPCLRLINYPQGVAFLYVGPDDLELSMNPYSHRCQHPLNRAVAVCQSSRINTHATCVRCAESEVYHLPLNYTTGPPAAICKQLSANANTCVNQTVHRTSLNKATIHV